MRVVSNAHFWQAEVVQSDRWDLGPLELAFVDERLRHGVMTKRQRELSYAIHEWNQSSPAALTRPGEALDILRRELRCLDAIKTPNVIFVPRRRPDGLTALHVMLASVLPDTALKAAGIERTPSILNLSTVACHDLPANFSVVASRAFSAYIWRKFAPRARFNKSFFSASSPLRLLADDTSFWMHRLYRIALDRWDYFEEVDDANEPNWKPLSELATLLRSSLPETLHDKVSVRRPLRGGDVWDVDDPVDRENVIEEAITGVGVMESLEPVIELLLRHRAHEDFSGRYSWVKEDFERSFYSKRSKLKVEIIETIDDAPVWNAAEPDGYERVLFRDVLAALNVRERTLLLALRMGKTATDIAQGQGLTGHAAISRRIKKLKAKVAKLLS
jgi:hypothetical protein